MAHSYMHPLQKSAPMHGAANAARRLQYRRKKIYSALNANVDAKTNQAMLETVEYVDQGSDYGLGAQRRSTGVYPFARTVHARIQTSSGSQRSHEGTKQLPLKIGLNEL
jgi:hypothetical protein